MCGLRERRRAFLVFPPLVHRQPFLLGVLARILPVMAPELGILNGSYDDQNQDYQNNKPNDFTQYSFHGWPLLAPVCSIYLDVQVERKRAAQARAAHGHFCIMDIHNRGDKVLEGVHTAADYRHRELPGAARNSC